MAGIPASFSHRSAHAKEVERPVHVIRVHLPENELSNSWGRARIVKAGLPEVIGDVGIAPVSQK